MLNNNNKGDKMITLTITKKEDGRSLFLNGEKVIKSFHNIKELTDYFMSEFSRWYTYNRFYWETAAKEWFSYEQGSCDDDTIYYFGNDFAIKLKERI